MKENSPEATGRAFMNSYAVKMDIVAETATATKPGAGN
jgi:hypothetical protein